MANYGSGSNWNGPDGGSRLPFNNGKDIPIILIILAFVFAWPLGLLLVLSVIRTVLFCLMDAKGI